MKENKQAPAYQAGTEQSVTNYKNSGTNYKKLSFVHQAVWSYLLKHPDANVEEIAKKLHLEAPYIKKILKELEPDINAH